eukprot:CAMPEP_0173253402 /NCGR_PEP_ID=MMETSP1142-20121109/21300_1 /TAXON_ID=483371 /ORGANISM="non described non described, Strain CCMP2298" /LENGTH=116 /DNA_ID=CAMNT_0014186627 /DNA_START=171 /DNA_END=518 /DNA_ORIENTATION=-
MSGPKKLVKTNAVTDAQGRVRFHGAFTGGFSAGHYNTVGSEEGWAPKQFVSSRGNRAGPQSNTAADYMDEGDGLDADALTANTGVDSFRDLDKGDGNSVSRKRSAPVSGPGNEPGN